MFNICRGVELFPIKGNFFLQYIHLFIYVYLYMNAELNPDEGFILAKDACRKKNLKVLLLMADFTNSLSINILNPSVLYLSDYPSNMQSFIYCLKNSVHTRNTILIYLSIQLSIYLSIYLYAPIYLFIYVIYLGRALLVGV